jgi:tetratricopeptide (TPR) repeat protein
MQKSQIIVLAGSVALCGILFSLPKVLVTGKDKVLTGGRATGAAAASSEAAHTASVPAEAASELNRLRRGFTESRDTKKKVRFADSLATAFRRFSQFDSAAHYAEVVALGNPSEGNLLKAGDAYYDALNFASDAAQAGRMGDKARDYYQKVLAGQPDQPDVKARMAITYVTTDNPMQGITMLREILQQDPDNQTALLNLGLLSIRSGQYDKAVERFEQILGKDPANEQARFYLGISYAEMGQPQKAKPVLQAIKDNTNDPVMKSTAEEYLKNLK